jgi:hypothetical protein
LVYFKGKIAIPTNLRFYILTWYHENLLHPGADRMFHTILQHFTWPSLRPQVENFVKTLQHLPTLQGTEKEVCTCTCLFWTSNKSLIHGIWLQSTPLDPGSFRSRHTLRNKKSLRHFKRLQLLTWIHTSWKL